MEILVQRDAYDIDETGYWQRMPVVAGLFTSIFSALAFGLLFPMTMGLPFSVFWMIVIGLSFGIPMGLAFTFVFPRVFRQKMSSIVDAIYAGDSQISAPPPADKEFSQRVVCSWMKSDNFALGGVLYIGRESLMFVPHTQNLAQHREPFEIAPLNNVELSIVEPRLNLLHRTLTQRPPRYLEVKWPDGKARFAVPEAEYTLIKIKNIIETRQMKEGEPVAASFDEKDLTPLEKVLRERL